MRRRPLALGLLAVATALALTGCTAGPETLDDIAAEFAQKAKPVWTTAVPGVIGEAAVAGDLVAVYRTVGTTKKSLRIAVYSTATGKRLWEHAAATAGEYAAPLFSETASARRRYPVPAMKPEIVERGTGKRAATVIVYFDRPGHDLLFSPTRMHVAQLRTGRELKLTVAKKGGGYGSPVQRDEKGGVDANVVTPATACGAGPILCWAGLGGHEVRLDLATLRVSGDSPQYPDRDVGPEWGRGLGNYTPPGGEISDLAFYRHGTAVWSRSIADLFGADGFLPPENVPMPRYGDVILVQGYRAIRQDDAAGTLSLDIGASRRVVAIDADTGKTLWSKDDGDALCYAAARSDAAPDAEVVPMCLATGGSYVYDRGTSAFTRYEKPVVSLVGVKVRTGRVAWTVPHAGENSVRQVVRLADWTFDAHGRYAAVAVTSAAVRLADLRTGATSRMPKTARFACREERAPLKQIDGDASIVNGQNLLSSQYPGGWQSYPCTAKGVKASSWTAGAVRLAATLDAHGRGVVLTASGLTGFAAR
jgi:hypothetical protein